LFYRKNRFSYKKERKKERKKKTKKEKQSLIQVVKEREEAVNGQMATSIRNRM